MPEKKVPAKCQHCGNEFMARPSKLRIGQGKYCSLSCSGAGAGNLKPHTGEQSPHFKGGKAARNRRRNQKGKAVHPLKYWARKTLSDAKRRGKITAQPCAECGTTIDVHAHHDDYGKPLEVQWLCRKHHRMKHEDTPCAPD